MSSAPTLAPDEANVDSAGADRPAVGLVAGSRPRLSRETQSLLRRRLRAVALFFLLAFTVFFLVNLVSEHSLPWALFALPVVLCAGALWVLVAGPDLSMRALRTIELSLFGGLMVFLVLGEYADVARILRQFEHADPLRREAELRVGLILFIFEYFALMLIYGMFIPNPWPRAAAVVSTMVAAPVGVALVAAARFPVVADVLTREGSAEDQLIGLIYLITGATLATYGTHVVHRLRTQVFEARQLGQYRLLQPLGVGGMGEVYLAEHQLLKRPCALKLIRPERVNDPSALQRFEREVRATAKLSHPNTIEIYDYGRTDDGVFYYVMEFLPGISLAEMVSRHGPMPAERVIHFLRQTCGALCEAHAMGMVHRDIKPANIFAAQRGGLFDVAKLLDFGLVKPLAEPDQMQLTQVGTISGSLLYISPEQALARQELDARTDIYALGATAYCLLTGRPPFTGETPTELIVSHVRDEVTPPSQLRDNVPEDLERVVLRCLAKAPADRYPDAATLEADLAACRDAGQWTRQRAARWWADHGESPLPASPQPTPADDVNATEQVTRPGIDRPE